MAINVTPIAGLSDHINDVRQRTARIVNEEILPNEALLWHSRRSGASEAERTEARGAAARHQSARSRPRACGPRTCRPSTAAWASTSWRMPT